MFEGWSRSSESKVGASAWMVVSRYRGQGAWEEGGQEEGHRESSGPEPGGLNEEAPPGSGLWLRGSFEQAGSSRRFQDGQSGPVGALRRGAVRGSLSKGGCT